MKIHITYDKPKVLQALRYHFISRKEIKLLLIAVNIFAVISAILFYAKKILPLAFMISSFLWFMLMLVFWFWLPRTIYKRSATFRDTIDLDFQDRGILLQTSRGVAEWAYNKFQYFIESPNFFHLYITDKSFFLVPKDACIGETDTMEVRKLLTEKIGRKK
ncbi:MAG: YcxB family protein [Chitinophagaceae bacterium]